MTPVISVEQLPKTSHFRRVVKFSIERKLYLPILALCLFFSLRPLWAAGLMNAFNLELNRLWKPVTLEHSDQNCIPIQDAHALQKMQSWLNAASRFIPDADYHQGQLNCLKGEIQLAKEIWREDVDHQFSALFAAMVSFPQNEFVETRFATQIGGFGFSNGLQSEMDGNITDAILWYRFTLAYTPGIFPANRLEYVYRLQGDNDKADNLWPELSQTVSPDFPLYWWAKGMVATLEGNTSDAGNYFYQGALQAEGKEAYRSYVEAGMVWYQVEKYEAAQDAFQRARLLEVDFSKGDLDQLAPYMWLSRIAQGQAKYSESLDFLTQALVINPTSSEALYQKAITLDALGRRTESVEALTAAIANHPSPPESWIALLEKWKK